MDDQQSQVPECLKMHRVTKRFGATQALKEVNFKVAKGEIHALIGENGAGKSTLMKILSGAILPDSGCIELNGQSYCPQNPQDARNARVAMIYQELSLAPHLTVEENIMLGREPARRGILNHKAARQQAQKVLAELGHPEIAPHQQVGKLSIAEQQLVEIARALAIGSELLIFDEPTSTLGYQDIQQLFKMIRHLKQQGHAIIYISHFLEEVKEISDRFTVLRDGQTVGGGKTPQTDIKQIVELMVGQKMEQLYPRSKRQAGKPVLEIKELSGIHKPISAEFTLHQGEVLGISGLVGAGRTELLRTIFGLDPIKNGQIKADAYLGPASPAKRWAQGFGLLSENRADEGLALSMNIADNITLSHYENLGFWKFIFPKRHQEIASYWIQQLKIRCRTPWQKVGELSGGNQQKVALARLLHHDVDVFILDEPTRGIDVSSKALIYEFIDRIATGDSKSGIPGKAVLIVSSYLPELLGICDRIAVMHRGVLGAVKMNQELDEHSLMLEATGQENKNEKQASSES